MPVVNIDLAFKVVFECRNAVVVGLRWPVMYASTACGQWRMLRVVIAALSVSVMITTSVLVTQVRLS
jgi:hypothetical protein